jgi:hypothetical protein
MDQVVRFLLCEVGRRSHERGGLFLAPGAAGGAALREGLAALQGLDVRTEIVLMAERPAPTGVPVTWISPTRLGTEAAFLVYCGEGPAYLLAQNAACPGDAPRLFQSSDRSLVEHLSFELARLCGVRIDV